MTQQTKTVEMADHPPNQMNETQTEFVASNAGSGQNAKILEYLQLWRGSWVAMPVLVEVGGGFAAHSRISDLRKLGYQIENRVDRSTKPYRSFYRLT